MENDTFTFHSQFENITTVGDGIVPAFFYQGETTSVFFDPGVSAYGPFYLQQIQSRINDSRNLIVALTHSHFDHAGAASYLRRTLPGMRIAASPKAAAVFQRPNAIETINRLNREYETEMSDEIGDEDVRFTGVAVDLLLVNGDVIDLGGGRNIRVLSTPGHTNDSLSFYFPHCGAVVTGEAAGVFEDGFLHTPYLTGYTDYLASIDAIQALQPRALCIAHNGILTGGDVSRFLDGIRKEARRYRTMIETYLDEHNGDTARVIERITAEEYDTRPNNVQKRGPFILNLTAKVKTVQKEACTG